MDRSIAVSLDASACVGLVKSLAEYYPDAKWQRCAVHFYRTSPTPQGRNQVVELGQHLSNQHRWLQVALLFEIFGMFL